ncbi:coatomer delta subunit, putative [Babesia caballi]|uniref:Coatomer subunit delta n=1 Tax=Babesia caballi TaxID=5871 RepID=A0AAV4LXP5_BABCB|nr:coatomer delta subunit, putative [Babesia caballi]
MLSGGDHTFVESEENRFVYQPLDEYYVFIMTPLESNIVRDIGVVKTLAEIVQTVVQSDLNEQTIWQNVYQLVFHMDELITNNQPEDVTLEQMKEFILMESKEEEKHKQLQTSKEKEEKERRRQIAAQLEKRHELEHRLLEPSGGAGAYAGQAMADGRGQTAADVAIAGIKQSIQRAAVGVSPLSLDAMRHAYAPKASEGEEGAVADAEAPAVVQVNEACNGSIQLEGDIDVLNVQGELVVTAFEESARMAALEISSNRDIKMRYHPSVDKQMAAKNRIELQSAQQGHKIGQSTSLVKWRHKTSDEVGPGDGGGALRAQAYFPMVVSCWTNTNAGKTTVTVEIQNVSETVVDEMNFQVMDSRYNQTVVNANELGVVQRNADSVNWVIQGLQPEETGKFEFTAQGNIDAILPFTLIARVPTSVTQLKRAPLATGEVRVKWHGNKRTGKDVKAYYYVCDDGVVRIPQFARKRAFMCNILRAATSRPQYCEPTEILQRLKVSAWSGAEIMALQNIAAKQDFEEVRSLFLDIYRWFAFRKNAFVAHELFEDIRDEVRAKHFFFGRVYSRVLRTCFKFSRCHHDHRPFSLVNYYVKWDSGDLPVEQQRIGAVMRRTGGETARVLMDRIAALVELHDREAVLNTVFSGVSSYRRNMYLDTRVSNLKVLSSAAAVCLHRWLTTTDHTWTVALIHQVSRVEFPGCSAPGDVAKRIEETMEEYGLRMSRSVSSVFEQVYKLLQRLKEGERPERVAEARSIGYESTLVCREELFAINLLAKLWLFDKHRDVEFLLRGLFDLVAFLSERVAKAGAAIGGSEFIASFEQTVCVPYLCAVMKAVSYEHGAVLRMKAILDGLDTGGNTGNHALYLSNAALSHLMSFGMSRFCSLFNYSAPHRVDADDVFAILTRGEHTYIYRQSDGQIVASTDRETMDLWNVGNRGGLSGPMACQLVIRSYATAIDESLENVIKRAKAAVAENVGVPLEFSSVVNFHLPRYASVEPIREFHPKLFETSCSKELVEHPIHKFLTMVVDK